MICASVDKNKKGKKYKKGLTEQKFLRTFFGSVLRKFFIFFYF